MFGKLKEKLQNWTKNLVKKSEEAEKVKKKSEKELEKKAKKDQDWRFVRRKHWAEGLQKSCAESAPSNG